MAKRTHFTSITPLPEGITRETVMSTLHSHTEMIDLNPLVIGRHPIRPPPEATPEEAHAQWYEITDKIAYLPAGLYTGTLKFLGCFHDLEDGLQTRVVAPMGLDMKGRWTLGGTLPGEVRKKQELGLGLPKSGLWLREDVDMKVNVMMTGFVKKTTKKAHNTLVARLIEKSHLKETEGYNAAVTEQISLRESYPPDYHSGILSPGAPSSIAGAPPYGRESQYSTAMSDNSSLRSQGRSLHGQSTPGSTPNPQQPQQQGMYGHQNLPPGAGYPPPLHGHQHSSYPPDQKYLYQPHPQYPTQAAAAPAPYPYPDALRPHGRNPGYSAGMHSPPLEVRNAHPLSIPPTQQQYPSGGTAVELPSQGDKTPAELGVASPH